MQPTKMNGVLTHGRRLPLAVLLVALLFLGVSCGSGGDDPLAGDVVGSTPTGGYTPDTTGDTPLPGTPPGEVPDDGAPDDGVPDDGAPDDGVPGDDPEPSDHDKRRVWEGFENVVALATDPHAGTVWAIDHETGQVYRKLYDAQGPEFVGIWNPAYTDDPVPVPSFVRGPVRGLAFRTPDAALLAVVDRGENDPDELIAIDPGSLEAVMIGPIGNRTGVESLAWNEAQAVLYGVDVDEGELISIAGNTAAVLGKRALAEPFDAVDGLAVDDAGRCLYGSDAERGVMYRFALIEAVPFEPSVPDAQLMGKTVDGRMEGLAFLPARQFFYGVDPGQGKLFLSDVMGNEIRPAGFLGLAFCEDDGLLYASDVATEKLVGIQPDSRWKHNVGDTGVALLDGLAPAEEGAPYLYGLSSGTQMLYRVDKHDGHAEPIVAVRGPGAPYAELKSLAYGRGRLYAVDAGTSDLLRIDPTTGAADVLATIGRLGIHGLAYEVDAKLLHAYSDNGRTHLMLPLSTPENLQGAIPHDIPKVGGLAFEPGDGRLWASDLRLDELTSLYETPAPARMPYEAVHAITWNHDARLLGADRVSGAVFEVDALTQDVQEWLRVADANIEAIAADPDTGRVYLSDTNGPHLLVMEPDRTVDYVREVLPPHDPVVLPTDGLKAMAWDPVHQVLLGVDLNGAGGATVVVIEPETGAFTALPTPIGFETVEALAWNPDPWELEIVRLLAVDRDTRTLIEINLVPNDPEIGRGYPFGFQLPEALDDVRGATMAPHDPSALQVVNAAEGRVHTIDSTTGEVLR